MDRYRQTKLTEHFIEAVWKDETGNRIDCAEHQLEWHKFIREQRAKGRKRIGILAPFKHGKTPHMLGISLYEISENPEIRIGFVCNDDDNAKKRVSALKQYIDRDEDYRALYGDKIIPAKDEWTKHALSVERKSKSVDPTLEAAGITTTGIGGTKDLILFDDPTDLNNSVLSAAKRENVKEMGNGVWLSRLDANGVAILIGTAWHADDWVHTLINNQEWVWCVQRVSEDIGCIEQIVVEN